MQNKEQLRQQKFSMIEEWRRSGLSQKAYCAQNNIAYHIFHYWYKHYRKTRPTADVVATSFVKLEVSPGAGSAHLELLLPGGKRLLFYRLVSSDYLKSVIS